MNTWTGALAAVIAATTITACSSGTPEGCIRPDPKVAQAIVEGGKQDGLTLSSGTAAAVRADSGVYYVAAHYEVDGDSGEAVWVVGGLDGSGPIMSAEGMSEALTNWPRLPGADAGSEGVRDAIACAG